MALGLGVVRGHRSPPRSCRSSRLVLGFGIALAFSSPASRSLPADLVDADRLPWLIARSVIAFEIGIIAGPVLGGFLYAADVRLPFVAIAGLLLLMAAAIMVVRIEPRPRRRRRRSGARPTSADADRARPRAEVAAGGGRGAGRPATARPRRHGRASTARSRGSGSSDPSRSCSARSRSTCSPCSSAARSPCCPPSPRTGSASARSGWAGCGRRVASVPALMTLGLAVRPITRRVGSTLLATVALFGVFTIVLGVTRSCVVAFVAILGLSAADSVSVFIRATLVPLITPEDKRGRVLAVENVFIGASNELGAFESGVSGQLLGTTGSVVLGGIATLVIAISWRFLFPSLRRVDRFPTPDEPDGVSGS